MTERHKCCKCPWTGTNNQKHSVNDKEWADIGMSVLVCPDCGSREFYVIADMRPVFIPLKKKYFTEFLNGKKDTEYRPYGKRWNENTCVIGRRVTLSLGYGKSARISGEIESFNVVPIDDSTGKTDFIKCYGYDHPGPIAEIRVIKENQG